MEHYDFICKEGLSSLRLLQRNPCELGQPIEGLRVHIRSSDCVAATNVDADNWSGFVRLFSHDYKSCGAAAWISPAGEWTLRIEQNDDGTYVFTSVLDSLLEHHRWVVQTQFEMTADQFQKTANSVLQFLGAWD
ncbi:hypothetical protein LOC67_21375 [Stieleria sp. JC731]|uniref:hypothetical protein n=1 Tax=Pirellulaceae TaxID=2691357 RepID=UPI001E62B6B5|nr:hypothetical protein [Stieleria sp. JC731]MCC9603109.1 hypothetical protein [Stieleria sp. JC731]